MGAQAVVEKSDKTTTTWLYIQESTLFWFWDPAENLSFVSMDGRTLLADAQKTQMQIFLRQYYSFFLIFGL